LVLKAAVSDRIIGSVRAHAKRDTCYIGKLIVYPELENQGIGKRLISETECRFPEDQRYELFTRCKSERNEYFYNRLGYRPLEHRCISEKLTLVFLEKLPDQDCPPPFLRTFYARQAWFVVKSLSPVCAFTGSCYAEGPARTKVTPASH
jgi:GNAT superfamily N-acetyltransferase